MSKVKVTITHAPTVTRPRVVTSVSGAVQYRMQDGQVVMHDSGIVSAYNRVKLDNITPAELRWLADLKENPAETVNDGEDTVTIEMPRSVAKVLREELGRMPSPPDDPTYPLFDQLTDALETK